MENYYDVLGVSPSADRGAIRRQYRRLAWALHPDRRSGAASKARAAVAMTRVSQAYETLHDPARRERHDLMLQGRLPLAAEQHTQAMLRVAAALAEVMRREPGLPGVDQALVNRILAGAAEHLPRALELVQDRILLADGAMPVAGFMALAKSFTSFASRTQGLTPEPAYLLLIRATAEECVRGTAWQSRLTWPGFPPPASSEVELLGQLSWAPAIRSSWAPSFRSLPGRLRNWLPQWGSQAETA